MTKETQAPQDNQFGTFGGIFTPSISTILCVVMMLLVVGNGEGDELGAVASILTMFFLFTDGMTNFATFVELRCTT